MIFFPSFPVWSFFLTLLHLVISFTPFSSLPFSFSLCTLYRLFHIFMFPFQRSFSLAFPSSLPPCSSPFLSPHSFLTLGGACIFACSLFQIGFYVLTRDSCLLIRMYGPWSSSLFYTTFFRPLILHPPTIYSRA